MLFEISRLSARSRRVVLVGGVIVCAILYLAFHGKTVLKTKQSRLSANHNLSLGKNVPDNLGRVGHGRRIANAHDSYLADQKIMLPLPVQPLNLSNSQPVASPLTRRIIEILKYKIGGFFVEYNANDGEASSKTLMLEREYGWTGLLIEYDLSKFEDLIFKRRLVYLSRTCLKYKPAPGPRFSNTTSTISNRQLVSREPISINTKCYALHILLGYIDPNMVTVDYLCLDIRETSIFDVLRLISWEVLFIRTVSVRITSDDLTKNQVTSLMTKLGYIKHQYEDIDEKNGYYIFVKKA